MDQELVQYLDERFNGLVTGLDRRFDEVNDRIEEVKRHSGVLVEGLRHELQLVAEGLITHINVRHAEDRSEEHTSELQSRLHLVCRLLLEKKKKNILHTT